MTELAAPSWWPAPAKINLVLHVTGRRADGYHTLQTVFQLLDWSDRIGIRVRTDGRIRRVGSHSGVAAEQDLVVRAARALADQAGKQLGADITVDKRIPVGAGLGGGSSDAATVLLVLNALWDAGVDQDQLTAIGAELGADVPVFVHGHSAWAEGIGERLSPLTLGERWYLLIETGCRVSTAALFAAPELTRDAPQRTISCFVRGAMAGNAFEPVVRARFPEVAAALDWLAAESSAPAQLSGSGGAVFAAFPSRAEAEAVGCRVPQGWQARVARGVDESPLKAALALFSVGA